MFGMNDRLAIFQRIVENNKMESQCSLRSLVATYCNAMSIVINKYMCYLFHQQSDDSTSKNSKRLIRF